MDGGHRLDSDGEVGLEGLVVATTCCMNAGRFTALSSKTVGFIFLRHTTRTRDLYRSTEREKHHVDVHQESRFRILALSKVLVEPQLVAFDACYVLVPVNLLTNDR